jgi:hypothetical protein
MPMTSESMTAYDTTAAEMPHATLATLPTIITPTNDTRLFSPNSLLNPLPQIVPGPTSSPEQTCNPLTQWVSDNPLLAAIGLGALAFWALGSKR